jgi:hypothetical protein
MTSREGGRSRAYEASGDRAGCRLPPAGQSNCARAFDEMDVLKDGHPADMLRTAVPRLVDRTRDIE